MRNKSNSAKVKQREGFVEITFPDNTPKDAIKAQVEKCQAATCDCCTPAFREKVTEFDTSDLHNNKIKVYGTIAEEEVEKNIISCTMDLKK
jgi:hypothetical protein